MDRYKKILANVIIPVIVLYFSLMLPIQSQAEDSISMTLEEATHLALENNFSIQMVKYDVLSARTRNEVSESIYDAIFEADLKYQKDESKKTSTLLGSSATNNQYNVALSQQLPSGTNLRLGINNERSASDSVFATSSVTHESVVGLTVSQDLGRNFFGLTDRSEIKITQLEVENTGYISLDDIESQLALVQKVFWELAFYQEQVNINTDMLEQAKRLFDLHQEQLKDGLIEVPEAIASEANYKNRLNELKIAQNYYNRKNNELRLLLNIKDSILISPVFDEQLPDIAQQQLSAQLKKAFDERRDFKRLKNNIESKNIQISMKNNELWPEINLSATLARNGLGDHFNESFENTIDEDHPDFTAGVTVRMPLTNKKSRAQKKAAEFNKAKSILELKRLERRIALDIENQVRDCAVNYDVARSSLEIQELQNQKLLEEEKRFKYGRSTTDAVIRFQEDYLRSRLTSATNKLNYRTSLIDLEMKKGILLNQYWDGEI